MTIAAPPIAKDITAFQFSDGFAVIHHPANDCGQITLMSISDDRLRQPLSCATFKWLTPTLRVKTTCPFAYGPAIIFARLDQIYFLHRGLTYIRDEETRIIKRLVLSRVEGETIGIAKSISIDLGAACDSVCAGIVSGDQIILRGSESSRPVDVDAQNFSEQRKSILC